MLPEIELVTHCPDKNEEHYLAHKCPCFRHNTRRDLTVKEFNNHTNFGQSEGEAWKLRPRTRFPGRQQKRSSRILTEIHVWVVLHATKSTEHFSVLMLQYEEDVMRV